MSQTSTPQSRTNAGVYRFTYPSTATKKGGEIWVMNAKFSGTADCNSVPSKKYAVLTFLPKPQGSGDGSLKAY